MISPKFWCLYSGGKDSTSAVKVLADRNMLKGCLSFDTGISAPDWRPFIEETCKAQGWPLKIIKTTVSYDDLVRKYGFPGPGMHPMFMNYLKGRCVVRFRAEYPGECLASGARKDESSRRFRSTQEWSLFERTPVWNPIFNWTTEETWKFFNSSGFKRSPAYSTLCISGDCLCGAFATEGERDMIACAYPEVDNRLSKLEKEKGEKWGARALRSKAGRQVSPLCTDCDKRQIPLI